MPLPLQAPHSRLFSVDPSCLDLRFRNNRDEPILLPLLLRGPQPSVFPRYLPRSPTASSPSSATDAIPEPAFAVGHRDKRCENSWPVHPPPAQSDTPDRKSTRLNSSHLVISYAVFCLK